MNSIKVECAGEPLLKSSPLRTATHDNRKQALIDEALGKLKQAFYVKPGTLGEAVETFDPHFIIELTIKETVIAKSTIEEFNYERDSEPKKDKAIKSTIQQFYKTLECLVKAIHLTKEKLTKNTHERDASSDKTNMLDKEMVTEWKWLTMTLERDFGEHGYESLELIANSQTGIVIPEQYLKRAQEFLQIYSETDIVTAVAIYNDHGAIKLACADLLRFFLNARNSKNSEEPRLSVAAINSQYSELPDSLDKDLHFLLNRFLAIINLGLDELLNTNVLDKDSPILAGGISYLDRSLNLFARAISYLDRSLNLFARAILACDTPDEFDFVFDEYFRNGERCVKKIPADFQEIVDSIVCEKAKAKAKAKGVARNN